MTVSVDLAVELSIRIFLTAGIVIGITLAVERLGVKVGGALAGLPIVIGPAFFFVLREHSVAFSANAATASLMSLSASQAFLMGYVAFAARSKFAIVAATLAWIAVAMTLAQLPPSPWLALALFVSMTAICRSWGRRFLRPIAQRKARGTLALLLLRGLAAGLLVAVVTVASDWLGPVWAGLLITYPIGLTVISVTIHQRSGADMAVATLQAVMTGIGSLAAFAFTLAVLLEPLGPTNAFVAATLASLLLTVVLIYGSARPIAR